jgi:probable phosphoglycerate mutase
MKIIFARHGESQANILNMISNRKLPHALTPKGREESLSLAERFKDSPIKKIYTSPVSRAVETGDIIARHLGIEPQVVDALREFDCGIMEGHSDKEAWRSWEEIFDTWLIHQRYDQCIEGGESFNDVRQRFVPFIEGLISEYADTQTQILCISHGGIYSIMLPLVMKNVTQAMISRYGFAYTSTIVAEEIDHKLVCTAWNDHSILDN